MGKGLHKSLPKGKRIVEAFTHFIPLLSVG